MMFRGKLHVFSAEPVTIVNPKYVNTVLQNPNPDSTAQIKEIHFAQPFLGYPFVVAEFDDEPGTYIAYWLEEQGSWKPETVYMLGESVLPSVQTGYSYSAQRLNPAQPAWSKGKAVQVGDFLEPTVFNGYMYEIISIDGPGTTTGAVEPNWTASEGAVVIEDVDVGVQTPDHEGAPTDPYVPPDVRDRYGNQGGFGSQAALRRVDEEGV